MTFLTPNLLKGTDWRAWERAVARVMSHCGWDGVQVIGRSGDGGGDVVGSRYENGHNAVYVVQVKAVEGSSYVGPSAIQEALDALPLYCGDIAVVATNGDFTKSALNRRDELKCQGFDVRLWNGSFLEKLLARHPEHHWQRSTPRPYQAKIIAACLAAYENQKKRCQFVLATGLGKSIIAAEVLVALAREGLTRSLVLCHTQDLALQLEQSFWRQLSKDLATRVFFDGASPVPITGVNFGLYQTLLSYLPAVEGGAFDVLIVDEAHHAMAHGFRQCIDRLHPQFLVGMTATPWRGDEQSLDDLFGEPLATMSIVDGMKLGYLAQVDYRVFCDNIQWGEIPKLTRGQMTVRDLNKRLFLPQRDDAIVSEIKRVAQGFPQPRVIVFCASIAHARHFAEMLSYAGLDARCLSGVDRLQRNRSLTEFASGKVKMVTAVDVLNEGIDVPDVNVLVFLRSTHSRRIFVQQLGRGLRVKEGKDRVIALDFVADIRRVAALLDMDKETREPKEGIQKVYFPGGLVHFDDQRAETFFREFLADISAVGDADQDQVLQFP